MTMNITKGRALRDEGMARADAGSDGQPWKDAAHAALDSLIKAGQPFTSDDVFEKISDLVEAHEGHIKAMGSIFAAASRGKRIRKTGLRVQTRRPSSHARDLTQWVAT